MDSVIAVEHLQAGVVFILDHAVDGFTGLSGELNRLESTRDIGPWTGESFPQIVKIALGADVRQIRSEQAAAAAYHVTLAAAGLGSVYLLAARGVSGDEFVGSGGAQAANVRHDPPDIVIGRLRRRHQRSGYAVLDGIEQIV